MKISQNWQETKNGLYKEFIFVDFASAFSFMQKVAERAEQTEHHPRWENDWNTVKVWLYTHSERAVTDKDRQMAEFMDELTAEVGSSIKTNAESEVLRANDTKKTLVHEVKLYGDGGSRGNPGPSASGYVLYDMNGNILVRNGAYLGITTNNQAEYLSLKLGLENALKIGVHTVHVHMDSLLVVNQMLGKFKVKNRDLWPIYSSIQEMLPKFKKVTFVHVPRALNKEADSMVNELLDKELGITSE